MEGTVPNPAAVLDLNANDTINYGTKGLALPRVSLTAVSTPLAGTPVVKGMMVYNTNASTIGGSGVGPYYWDGASWLSTKSTTTPVNNVSWISVIDTTLTVPALPASAWIDFNIARIAIKDFCYDFSDAGFFVWPYSGGVRVTFRADNTATPATVIRFGCFRPTIL